MTFYERKHYADGSVGTDRPLTPNPNRPIIIRRGTSIETGMSLITEMVILHDTETAEYVNLAIPEKSRVLYQREFSQAHIIRSASLSELLFQGVKYSELFWKPTPKRSNK